MDVVVAGNHLHALPDIDAALRHVHSVLGPGGWIAVIEQTHDDDPALLVSTEFLEAAAGPVHDARAVDGRASSATRSGSRPFTRPDSLSEANFRVRTSHWPPPASA